MFIDRSRRIGATARSVRLLVIEDEPLLALQLSDVLTELGWSVDCLNGAADAAGAPFPTGYPDAAVVDADVRDMPVALVARSLQRLDIPLVLCTGTDAVEGEAFSGCRSVRKPASPQEIVRGLRKAAQDILERSERGQDR